MPTCYSHETLASVELTLGGEASWGGHLHCWRCEGVEAEDKEGEEEAQVACTLLEYKHVDEWARNLEVWG